MKVTVNVEQCRAILVVRMQCGRIDLNSMSWHKYGLINDGDSEVINP